MTQHTPPPEDERPPQDGALFDDEHWAHGDPESALGGGPITDDPFTRGFEPGMVEEPPPGEDPGGGLWPLDESPQPENTEEAVFWAQALLQDPDTVFLDTETTGVGADAEALSIAVVDTEGRRLLVVFIRPSSEALADEGVEEALAINQFDLHEIMDPDGPHEDYARVAGDVEEALAGRRVVAYNVAFDRRILEHTAEKAGCPKIEVQGWYCAQQGYTAFTEGGKASLAKAIDGLGMPQRRAHDALEDARMALDVIRGIAGLPSIGTEPFEDEGPEEFQEEMETTAEEGESTGLASEGLESAGAGDDEVVLIPPVHLDEGEAEEMTSILASPEHSQASTGPQDKKGAIEAAARDLQLDETQRRRAARRDSVMGFAVRLGSGFLGPMLAGAAGGLGASGGLGSQVRKRNAGAPHNEPERLLESPEEGQEPAVAPVPATRPAPRAPMTEEEDRPMVMDPFPGTVGDATGGMGGFEGESRRQAAPVGDEPAERGAIHGLFPPPPKILAKSVADLIPTAVPQDAARFPVRARELLMPPIQAKPVASMAGAPGVLIGEGAEAPGEGEKPRMRLQGSYSARESRVHGGGRTPFVLLPDVREGEGRPKPEGLGGLFRNDGQVAKTPPVAECPARQEAKVAAESVSNLQGARPEASSQPEGRGVQAQAASGPAVGAQGGKGGSGIDRKTLWGVAVGAGVIGALVALLVVVPAARRAIKGSEEDAAKAKETKIAFLIEQEANLRAELAKVEKEIRNTAHGVDMERLRQLEERRRALKVTEKIVGEKLVEAYSGKE